MYYLFFPEIKPKLSVVFVASILSTFNIDYNWEQLLRKAC